MAREVDARERLDVWGGGGIKGRSRRQGEPSGDGAAVTPVEADGQEGGRGRKGPGRSPAGRAEARSHGRLLRSPTSCRTASLRPGVSPAGTALGRM